IAVVRAGRAVGGGDDGQNPAGVGQGGFSGLGGALKFFPQIAPPSVGVRFGIVDQPTPHAILVVKLLPVVFRVKRFVGVRISTAWLASPHAAFKRKRLEKLDAEAPREAKRTPVTGGHGGVAP